MIRLRSLTVLMITCALLSGGCATYVNIPPLPGDVASHNPNNASVQHVTRVALDEVLRRFPPRDVYMVALPEGTSEEAYHWVLRDLPDGGSVIGRGMGDEPVYEVASIYIRGTSAQADIIPPDPDSGQPRLFTVYLGYGWGGWRVERTRQWNIPVERALRSATPAGETPAEREPEREQPAESEDDAAPPVPSNGSTDAEADETDLREMPPTPELEGSPSEDDLLPPLEEGEGEHMLDSQPD